MYNMVSAVFLVDLYRDLRVEFEVCFVHLLLTTRYDLYVYVVITIACVLWAAAIHFFHEHLARRLQSLGS